MKNFWVAVVYLAHAPFVLFLVLFVVSGIALVGYIEYKERNKA